MSLFCHRGKNLQRKKLYANYQNSFALKVKSDSMHPKFKKEDYVVALPDTGRESENDVIGVNAGNIKTLKKIKVHKEQEPILLKPENAKYLTIVLIKEDKPRVIGKIVKKIQTKKH